MTLARFDVDVASVDLSSPQSSRHHTYFVQSPSRDSHEDGDGITSMRSSVTMDSPLIPSASSSRSVSRNPSSRDSLACSSFESSSYVSFKHGFKNQPIFGPLNSQHRENKKGGRWTSLHIINEDAESQHHISSPGLSRYAYSIFLALLSGTVVLTFCILVFWLICRPSHPHFSLKNAVFHNFYMGQGVDSSGVPTKMVSVNLSLQVEFENPSTYFGVHISPLEASLVYSGLNIAKGEISKYFQVKRSRKLISMLVQATRVPIYGAGNSGSQDVDESIEGIHFTTVVTTHSMYYVVGKLVKSKFLSQASCNIVLDSMTMTILSPMSSSCTYIPPI